MTDTESIAYIVGWLHGFEPMVWAMVGEKLADEEAAEYGRLVAELGKLLGIRRSEVGIEKPDDDIRR